MSSYSSRYDDGHRHATGASRRHGDRDAEPYNTHWSARDRNRARDTEKGGAKREGIKHRTFGDAFLTREQDAYLQQQLRGQLTTHAGSDTPSSGSKATGVTPRMIVDEIKRSGHFDQLRKQLLAGFQSSPHKNAFTAELQTFLLAHLEAMSPEKRQRLARQDARLQHSDLERVLEEDADVGKIFDSLMSNLRKGEAAPDASLSTSESTGLTAISRNVLFAANDGALYGSLESRLKETIEAEQRQAALAAAESVHGDKHTLQPSTGSDGTPTTAAQTNASTGAGTGGHTGSSGHSDAGSATPHVKSTANTPLRREVMFP